LAATSSIEQEHAFSLCATAFLHVTLCRTSATCQRDDEYELALANPEQLRVRGRLRQVARDRGAAACTSAASFGRALPSNSSGAM
jgi:hypothetical protein